MSVSQSAGAPAALVVMALLTLSASAARAETTTLICHLNDRTLIEDEPTIVDLDEANSSAAIQFGKHHLRPEIGYGPPFAEPSFGSAPATFGATTITIKYPNGGEGTINRLTGDFKSWTTYTCQPAKRQF